jgi:hypothetical protein
VGKPTGPNVDNEKFLKRRIDQLDDLRSDIKNIMSDRIKLV